MIAPADDADLRLLDEWQRDFPLVPRPFAWLGDALGVSEAEVLDRLGRMVAAGAVSRVGAAVRPNTAGASTLAAVAAPDWRIDEMAGIIGREPGVNHSYLRENDWNIWFVATGPDRAHVDATLARIERATGLDVLDLPLERAYHIDLGFSLGETGHSPGASAPADAALLRDGDAMLLQALSSGLALRPRPYAALGRELGREEEEVMDRIAALSEARIISRFGIIVRHRALGWRANAMVVWKAPAQRVDELGARLAAEKGVTLCYRRRTHPERWPYNLYCMIHSRAREAALETLDRATEAAGLSGVDREILFSLRCFKQTGALIDDGRRARA